VLAHLRVPLHRDGYALALNTSITAIVGLLYWVVAAHLFPPRVVGMNAALIAAMQFVAGIATFNLANLLVRFLAQIGGGGRRLLLAAYGATAVAATAGSIVFLAVAGELSAQLRFVGTSVALLVTFAVATIAWCVFVLQDGALIGLGRAVWVPVENAVFAVAKVVLLLAFAALLPTYGIFVSWTVAMLLSVAGVNVLLFGRLLRRRDAGTPSGDLGPPRALARYFAADLVCALAWIASTTLLPVIVTGVEGATANAAFALAWAVAFPLYAVTASLGDALVVHGAGDPASLPALVRRAALQGLCLVGGAVLVLVAAAPWVLRLFGASYAADGATTLRLVALGALPNLVVTLWVSVARVRRGMRGAVGALVGQAAITLGLVGPLLQALGTVGAGVAWLAGQSVVAAAVLWRLASAHLAVRSRVRAAGRELAADTGRRLAPDVLSPVTAPVSRRSGR
jgi:O-antigen/teichoic acid export membrane protein